ncbi:MAG: ROK family protein [Deltaproteobacteria bacterium]|nr:ROK family protein [Deltaproteobacteria bacterium]
MAYKIGIDLGGTKTEIILLDKAGKEIFRHRNPTPGEKGYRAILDNIDDLYALAVAKIPKTEPFTIGIGIPGTLDKKTNLVQNANTTCLIGQPLHSDLEKILHHPLKVENDANCFTLAETVAGAAVGYDFVFGIIMGTGCGGGICIDGRIRQGNHQIAGEWGHFSADPNGNQCYCGNRGCVETLISGSGVEKNYLTYFDRRLSMKEIVDGYRNGDTACARVFQQFLEDFGRCVGGVISILDPDAVVIGGGLSNIPELYRGGIDQIRRFAFHRRVETPILKNKLGDSAGVIGAASLGI